MQINSRLYALLIALFVFGLFMGSAVTYLYFRPTPERSDALRLSMTNPTDEYAYIDPLLAVKSGTPDIGNYGSLEQTVQGLVGKAKQQGEVITTSIYFADLVQTTGFIINPSEQYSPASLLKVPTMMSYLKLAESRPSILNETLSFAGQPDQNTQEHLRSSNVLEPGNYTISTLIAAMIHYSDNNAADVLINFLNNTNNQNAFDGLMNDLGITQIDLTDDFMTIRAYSLFFRVLYNATYLNRNMSERALDLLTKTDFAAGLDQGIPNFIQVAHKFGEFTQQSPTGQIIKNELHDCGIIYYPHNPYLLCIMTKGVDFTKQEHFIGQISAAAYQEVSKQQPQ